MYIAHEIDSMQVLSWVEWMRDKRTLLWLQKSQQRPQVQMRTVLMALIFIFQCRKNKYISISKGWSWQIRLADLLKIHIGVELDPHKLENLSVKEKQLLFCSRLTPILQDKKQTETIKIKTFWNSSEIDAILAWATKWWMPLSVTRVVNALLCSDELYCPLHQSGVAVYGATPWTGDRVKLLQSPYFFHPSPPRF